MSSGVSVNAAAGLPGELPNGPGAFGNVWKFGDGVGGVGCRLERTSASIVLRETLGFSAIFPSISA